MPKRSPKIVSKKSVALATSAALNFPGPASAP
jgi:hypothetical protein